MERVITFTRKSLKIKNRNYFCSLRSISINTVVVILPSKEELCHVPADHEWHSVAEPQTQSKVATNSLERSLPLRL